MRARNPAVILRDIVVPGGGSLKPALIFSGLYTSHFLFLGMLLPFFSGWLALRGFSASEIGWINGVALICRLLVGPIVAIVADKSADKRLPLILVSFLFSVSGILMVVSSASIIIAISAAMIIWCFGLLVPLSDSMVLRADREGLLAYGPVRAIGSLAFLVTTILGGYALEKSGLTALGPALALSCVLALVMAFTLPRISEPSQPEKPAPHTGLDAHAQWGDIIRLLKHPVFIVAIIAAGLIQAAHAVYYTYSILHWTGLGYSTTIIGYLWAIGVITEIFLLTKARGIVGRLAPQNLLMLGGLASLVRWLLTALEPALPILFIIQTLHAFTFAATYLGTIEFIDHAIPKRLVNTGMVLFSTSGVGAFTGMAALGAGIIFDHGGAFPAYMMMAVMGGIGAMLALLLKRIWDGNTLQALQ